MRSVNGVINDHLLEFKIYWIIGGLWLKAFGTWWGKIFIFFLWGISVEGWIGWWWTKNIFSSFCYGSKFFPTIRLFLLSLQPITGSLLPAIFILNEVLLFSIRFEKIGFLFDEGVIVFSSPICFLITLFKCPRISRNWVIFLIESLGVLISNVISDKCIYSFYKVWPCLILLEIYFMESWIWSSAFV